ncbi:unnamed protein product [Rotaria sordida]|uniref:Uncharacterized protein n=1 Tax=Rotaria sordida TaxID=392033 RepID=A0A815KGJ5_9BILA|nr:unnamed protein product [Rotaria sordida]
MGCVSAFTAFSLTLYAGAGSLRAIIFYIFPQPLPQSQIQLSSLYDLTEYYQPRNFPGKERSVSIDHTIRYYDFNFRKPETLTYSSAIYDNNIEILYRLPRKPSISALLLIFHSCKHTAYDWFHSVERQRIIGAAIELGYACLVFQATNKISQCWSYKADIYENKDVQMVLKGLDGFYKQYPELVSLPIFTFGSSSGGIFSSIFATNQRHPIQGQVIYISIILPEILSTYVKTNNYPPTVWIHMLRDIEFASEDRINNSIQIFIEQNIPCNRLAIEPVRITRVTFRDRIPSINIRTSQFLFNRLQQNHWLNPYHVLMYNPRRKFSWKQFLFPSSIAEVKNGEVFNNINQNKFQISEFLNTMYGEHEISYERSFEALQWLEKIYDSSKLRTDSNN